MVDAAIGEKIFNMSNLPIAISLLGADTLPIKNSEKLFRFLVFKNLSGSQVRREYIAWDQ